MKPEERIANIKVNYYIINMIHIISKGTQKSSSSNKIFGVEGFNLTAEQKNKLLRNGSVPDNKKSKIQIISSNSGIDEKILNGERRLTILTKPNGIEIDEKWTRFFKIRHFITEKCTTEEEQSNHNEAIKLKHDIKEDIIYTIKQYQAGNLKEDNKEQDKYEDFKRVYCYLNNGKYGDSKYLDQLETDIEGFDFNELNELSLERLQSLSKMLGDKLRKINTIIEYKSYCKQYKTK